jgi:hypothetical protein
MTLTRLPTQKSKMMPLWISESSSNTTKNTNIWLLLLHLQSEKCLNFYIPVTKFSSLFEPPFNLNQMLLNLNLEVQV